MPGDSRLRELAVEDGGGSEEGGAGSGVRLPTIGNLSQCQYVKSFRRRHALTQEGLAKLLNVSRGLIAQWETHRKALSTRDRLALQWLELHYMPSIDENAPRRPLEGARNDEAPSQ